MKKNLTLLCLLFVLFIFAKTTAGQENAKIEKKKEYSKSYEVTSTDKVKFDNRFGDVKIVLWDKNEVKVDITMIGKATTEEVAQQVLDRIKITDEKTSNGVFFKTIIDDGKNWPKGNKYNNTGFSINYIIYMPSRNTLTIENEFGKTFIPDYSGEITINHRFGTLTAGKLGNVKKLLLEFSSGSVIESMNGGELSIKFSRAEVKQLEGSIKASIEHSSAKLGVDNSLKELSIKNNFTELYIDANKNIAASFMVHTNFSKLNNKSIFPIKEEGEGEDHRGPKFDHDYSGKTGAATIPIKIKSEFGEVIIGHNLSFDVSEKEEKKEKKKTRTV